MSNLIVQAINQFDLSNIINDRGSGAWDRGSFWAPDTTALGTGPDQYYYSGMFGTSNYECPPNPSGPLFAFQMYDDNGETALASPAGFSTVWTCSGNGQPSNLGFFNPIAPDGHITVGSIATMQFKNVPQIADYPNLMCVRQDLCEIVTLTQTDQVWTDRDSDAPQNVIIWKLPVSGAMYAIGYTRDEGYPSTAIAYDIVLPTSDSMVKKRR